MLVCHVSVLLQHWNDTSLAEQSDYAALSYFLKLDGAQQSVCFCKHIPHFLQCPSPNPQGWSSRGVKGPLDKVYGDSEHRHCLEHRPRLVRNYLPHLQGVHHPVKIDILRHTSILLLLARTPRSWIPQSRRHMRGGVRHEIQDNNDLGQSRPAKAYTDGLPWAGDMRCTQI